MKPAVERYARHVNPALVRLLGVFGYGRVFTRAQDVWLWDDEGRQYLDCLAGFGAVNIGHNHPRLLKRLHEFLASESINLHHIGPNPYAADLGEALATLAPPLERALFSSSGAEAVEAGLKLARAATGRTGFVYCENAYHGTTLGTLSVMGSPRLRDPFEPLLANCERIPFGDLNALDAAVTRNSAAFIVEPIQCEGGVILPQAGYLRDAQDLCRRRGALLILDEVQTGLGRTGTMFSYQAESFVPDVLVIAKSLGGSIAPISATLTTSEIHEKAYGSTARFDLHSSTFGGNAFAAVAALETIQVIADENLVARSAARGEQLLGGLRKRLTGHPLVRDVRGRGLLVGIELGPVLARSVFGLWASLKLLERGIICQPASSRLSVLRLEPPLTVMEPEVEKVIDAVADVLGEYRGMASLVKDVAQRMGEQFLRGGEFR